MANTFNSILSEKRKEKDKIKLLMSDYKVLENSSNPYDFTVLFKGPSNSPYEFGLWNVHVLLPDQYPYKSPSIGFLTKIFHPNIDLSSGTVCLDVINQSWSPMFDLNNIFDVFLPQLLLYPNPSSPLNPLAANLLMDSPQKYNEKVIDHVKKFCLKIENIKSNEKIQNSNSSTIEEEMSELSDASDISELSQTSDIELIEN